jgi:hypothetical protein
MPTLYDYGLPDPKQRPGVLDTQTSPGAIIFNAYRGAGGGARGLGAATREALGGALATSIEAGRNLVLPVAGATKAFGEGLFGIESGLPAAQAKPTAAKPHSTSRDALTATRGEPALPRVQETFNLSDSIRHPSIPSSLESTVNGVLPPQSLAAPVVYERSNIYGNKGITRFDDASGIPTFTNTGRAGYDDLVRSKGTVSRIPAFTPERAAQASQANAGLYKARLAASMGLTEEQYDGVMAARRQDREITALGRRGFSTKDVAGLMEENAKGALPDAREGLYTAQANKYATQAEGAALDNQIKQQLQILQQQLLTEPDPVKRQAIADLILTIQGRVQNQQPPYQAFTVPGGEDDFGNTLPPKVGILNRYGGDIRQAELTTAQAPGPTQAPAAAIEYLKKNPQLKEQFKAKYGYLP